MSNFSFNSTPMIKHSRSRFDLSHTVKTSGNVGTLYPFDVQEVYAGDTFKVKTACVSRLSSEFIKPVMDSLFLDVYYFFVPSRLLYDRYPEVFGENKRGKWALTEKVSVPVVSGTVPEKTIGDYMGLPTKIVLGKPVSVLPFRAFAKIYDDWFRDENNVDPVQLQKGERTASEVFNPADFAPNNYFGKPPKVAKLHDYFTSCLPAPQKGDAVDLPLAGPAPVFAGDPHLPIGVSAQPLTFSTVANNKVISATYQNGYNFVNGNYQGLTTLSGSSGGIEAPNPGIDGFTPSNLYADLSDVSGVSVNDLRFAFQYQKMLERDARGGTRYVEYLQSHFGVFAGDYRLQRSEFLGGRRSPISIHQVVQSTGANSDSSPLGAVGAYSHSNSNSRFTKGFTEHGYVIGVYCIRQFHTYQQGIERFWTRSERSDFFDPVFSNIGEQPVYKYELYGSTPSTEDSPNVFGYNEAWADLRRRQAHVTGQMRSNSINSYDVWHFADNYSNAPVLGAQFIEETPVYVDRSITVPSTSNDQFLLDFYIQNIAYRPLPTYSVPSLIDHN